MEQDLSWVFANDPRSPRKVSTRVSEYLGSYLEPRERTDTSFGIVLAILIKVDSY